jgi:hypothetical protein
MKINTAKPKYNFVIFQNIQDGAYKSRSPKPTFRTNLPSHNLNIRNSCFINIVDGAGTAFHATY